MHEAASWETANDAARTPSEHDEAVTIPRAHPAHLGGVPGSLTNVRLPIHQRLIAFLLLLAYASTSTAALPALIGWAAALEGSHTVNVAKSASGMQITLHHVRGDFTPKIADHQNVLARVMVSLCKASQSVIIISMPRSWMMGQVPVEIGSQGFEFSGMASLCLARAITTRLAAQSGLDE